MHEEKKQPAAHETGRERDEERAAEAADTHAQDQEESLKVHGDKYEGLIPRDGGDTPRD